MTTDAISLFACGVRDHPSGDRLVASEAVGQQDPFVERPDPDRLVEIPGGESPAVIEAVKAFDGPMAEKINRRMAIVACRDGFMRRPVPVVEMAPHDMAVHTDFRVVFQIGCALGEKEGEPAQAGDNPGQNAEKE
jgi:hypothetical protein